MSGVTTEKSDGVILIRLDEPETRNALSNEVLETIAGALDTADQDGETRAAVIAGGDKVFASGANLSDLATAEIHGEYFRRRASLWDSIRRTETPTVAAVSGFCLGGGLELALSCDVLIASEESKFGLPETRLGLIPGAGGTQRLVRAIGKAKAMDVVLAGRLLTATEAEAAGLVARLASPSDWLDQAIRVANEIAARGPLAVRLAKAAVNDAFETPLETGLRRERERFAAAFSSDDAREGIAAFLEKRHPVFQDC